MIAVASVISCLVRSAEKSNAFWSRASSPVIVLASSGFLISSAKVLPSLPAKRPHWAKVAQRISKRAGVEDLGRKTQGDSACDQTFSVLDGLALGVQIIFF